MAHESNKLIFFKCSYYPEPPIESMKSLQKFQGFSFSKIEKKNPKICMEQQKTLNSQAVLRKKKLEIACSLISNYTQSYSEQDCMVLSEKQTQINGEK